MSLSFSTISHQSSCHPSGLALVSDPSYLVVHVLVLLCRYYFLHWPQHELIVNANESLRSLKHSKNFSITPSSSDKNLILVKPDDKNCSCNKVIDHTIRLIVCSKNPAHSAGPFRCKNFNRFFISLR